MPRKTAAGQPLVEQEPPASMRPRPDAAENLGLSRREWQWWDASMRPRPDAAENTLLQGQPLPVIERLQ